MTRAPISIGEQAAALAHAWNVWVETGTEGRRRAAQLMRTSRASVARRSDLLPAIVKVLATRPNNWWMPSDLVAPLAELGWEQSATQIGKALAKAHARDLVRKRHHDGGRRVLYRSGEA